MAGEITIDIAHRFESGVEVGASLARTIAPGSILVLFGPSGAGKTTILRAIAGLMRPDRGRIVFEGRQWFDAAVDRCVPPQERRVGYVAQETALFPHLTVRANIEYGLRAATAESRRQRAGELIQLVGARGLEDRFPRQLSGGQAQRIALARALAPSPAMLLLDEPFGALDAFTREELWCTLRDLWEAQRFNVILVTHDLRESVFLADTVYCMSKSPGRFVVKREIQIPRTRDLEVTYTKDFSDIVHELRGHIGALRRPCRPVNGATP